MELLKQMVPPVSMSLGMFLGYRAAHYCMLNLAQQHSKSGKIRHALLSFAPLVTLVALLALIEQVAQ